MSQLLRRKASCSYCAILTSPLTVSPSSPASFQVKVPDFPRRGNPKTLQQDKVNFVEKLVICMTQAHALHRIKVRGESLVSELFGILFPARLPKTFPCAHFQTSRLEALVMHYVYISTSPVSNLRRVFPKKYVYLSLAW